MDFKGLREALNSLLVLFAHLQSIMFPQTAEHQSYYHMQTVNNAVFSYLQDGLPLLKEPRNRCLKR